MQNTNGENERNINFQDMGIDDNCNFVRFSMFVRLLKHQTS
jgi:hypothetical protein